MKTDSCPTLEQLRARAMIESYARLSSEGAPKRVWVEGWATWHPTIPYDSTESMSDFAWRSYVAWQKLVRERIKYRIDTMTAFIFGLLFGTILMMMLNYA